MHTQPPPRPEQTPPEQQKRPYVPPRLERHDYRVVTGASFGIGTNGLPVFGNPDDR